MGRCQLVVSVSVAVALFAAACGDNHKPPAPGDGSGMMPGPVVKTCEVLPQAASTCSVVAGGATRLLKGNVLTPTTVYIGGQVAVDATGKITCAGCNCAAGGETTITCPDAAISPGLINTHDHITFDQNPPYTATTERYEDRQQWREGLDGHAKIPDPSNTSAAQISWNELRFLMGGATSIVSSTGQPGFLRNLDGKTDAALQLLSDARLQQEVNQAQAQLQQAVADGPQSVILEQVTNGLAVRMAVMYLLAGVKA